MELNENAIKYFQSINFDGLTLTPTKYHNEARKIALALGMDRHREADPEYFTATQSVLDDFNDILESGEVDDELAKVINISDTIKYKIAYSGYNLQEKLKATPLKWTSLGHFQLPFRHVDESELLSLTEHIKRFIGDRKSFTLTIGDTFIEKAEGESQYQYKVNYIDGKGEKAVKQITTPMGLYLTLWRVIENNIEWRTFTKEEFEAEVKRVCDWIRSEITIN